MMSIPMRQGYDVLASIDLDLASRQRTLIGGGGSRCCTDSRRSNSGLFDVPAEFGFDDSRRNFM